MPTAAAVTVGVTGAVYAAPSGTAVPTTVAGSLNAAFNAVGYISEDGITMSTSEDTNDIKAWQNGTLVRRILTGHDFTVKFSMLETNERSLKLYYNSYTGGAGGADASVSITAAQGYRGAFVIDVVDGTDLLRYVFPDAQVTAHDDVVISTADAIQYGVTLTAYEDGSSVKCYLYLQSDYAS